MIVSTFRRLILVFLAIIVWFVVAYAEVFNPLLVPSPVTVIVRTGEQLIASDSLFYDVFSTLRRMIIGVAIAAIVGIPLGLLIGTQSIVRELTKYLLDFFRSIPATALIPLFLLLFGFGDFSRVMLVGFSVSLVFAVQTAYGVLSVSKLRIISARTLGASNSDILLKIIVPESSPYIVSAMRVGISLSLVLVIVSEMFIGTQSGIGYVINEAHQVYDIGLMYGSIIITGIIGLFVNMLVVKFENNAIHWMGR